VLLRLSDRLSVRYVQAPDSKTRKRKKNKISITINVPQIGVTDVPIILVQKVEGQGEVGNGVIFLGLVIDAALCANFFHQSV